MMAFYRHRTKRDKQEYRAPWKVTTHRKNGGDSNILYHKSEVFFENNELKPTLLYKIYSNNIICWQSTHIFLAHSILFNL